MPELIAFQGKNECINIPERIGLQWNTVGTLLLDDRDGSIIPAIAREYRDNGFEINKDILARWLQGRGIADTTWRGLLGVLKVHCPALAEIIEEAVTKKEATSTHSDQQQSTQHFFQSLLCCCKRQPQHTPSPIPDLSVRQQKCSHLLEETLTGPASEPPPTEQLPKPSSPSSIDPPKQPPPTCPTLKPQSAEWHLAKFLRRYYRSHVDPVPTWPSLPGKKFINLAVISREEIEAEEQLEFMLASLHGGVDQILQTKAPVKIEELLNEQQGEELECVLIEGAPGVGKSTLSWEICKRWAKEEWFQQYSLVLLLRLRDRTVQSAKTITDLLFYVIEESQDVSPHLMGISDYLKCTYGKHTLIILEGLDELPRDLLTHASIFTRFLAGSELRNATIMITSRPSATVQLWKNWKARISRHIEVLGFTEDNITEYVASILKPQEISMFNTYLCTAPSIRQMMYIPLHSGIVIEIYKMCTRSKKSLPTNKTALYKVLVQTILTRYLAGHPKYKNAEIEVRKFTDLPSDVYSTFRNLIELAYIGVTEQQLIFRDRDSEIQHLGFMDVVTELYALEHKAKYSYNFLHLSIQEFLGACHISLMDTGKQEDLLTTLCSQTHLRNMALFLAGLNKFKGLNSSIVKSAIHSTCKQQGEELTLSEYALETIYETESANLLDGYDYYRYKMSDFSPLFIFTAVGYCVSHSTFKWRLDLGSHTFTPRDTSQHMQSTERVKLLTQALSTQLSPKYCIDSLEFYHVQPDAEDCLPSLLPAMNQLNTLKLWYAPADILLRTLQAVASAPITTLREVDLFWSQFSSQAVSALCAVLVNNCQCISKVELRNCGIDNEGAFCLSRDLTKLSQLTHLYLADNAITDRGAWAVVTAVEGLRVEEVDLLLNSISFQGKENFRKFREENKAWWLEI